MRIPPNGRTDISAQDAQALTQATIDAQARERMRHASACKLADLLTRQARITAIDGLLTDCERERARRFTLLFSRLENAPVASAPVATTLQDAQARAVALSAPVFECELCPATATTTTRLGGLRTRVCDTCKKENESARARAR